LNTPNRGNRHEDRTQCGIDYRTVMRYHFWTCQERIVGYLPALVPISLPNKCYEKSYIRTHNCRITIIRDLCYALTGFQFHNDRKGPSLLREAGIVGPDRVKG
jgi:hypothetical protein